MPYARVYNAAHPCRKAEQGAANRAQQRAAIEREIEDEVARRDKANNDDTISLWVLKQQVIADRRRQNLPVVTSDDDGDDDAWAESEGQAESNGGTEALSAAAKVQAPLPRHVRMALAHAMVGGMG